MKGLLVLSAFFAVAASASEMCTLTHGEAFAKLRAAPGLVSDASMYEKQGIVPEMLTALGCVATSPDAVADLLRLLDEGNTAGQLYALVGLKVLAPDEFAARIAPYLSEREKVAFLGGDVHREVEVSRVSRYIEEGVYSVLLPRSVYTPEPVAVEVQVPEE
jgi:hypothetical protein